ncbi:TPA: DotD/TraH family lipoprotein [Klebsiella pneumoniae]|uniref:DotD/TraH family lipoprotein n=1 Tax=Klebsiella pneumoniae TaxID=573 RepID=UPI0007CA2B1E|nr:DotD/TraH family lipoprotein [Klebsiella pneumoniae]SAS18484.1 Uncharacterised protein [Klebsiella pneumoniae]HBW8106971.1 DotD/TraH family lipoprotein [Klebsiella pneumoniae]
MNRTMLTLLGSILLAGCQSPASSARDATASPYGAAADVARVRHAQYSMWGEGAINVPTETLFPGFIAAHSSRISLDWDGDAVELLAALARQRGMTFSYSGVRLPLPVTLHVRNMTFANVLRLIDAQISWRAQLHEPPGEFQLLFMPATGGKK